MTMTFDEYDSLIELMKNKLIKEKNIHPAYPDSTEIEKFKDNDDDWIRFAVFIYEFSPKPKTNEQRYARKALFQYLKKNLMLEESE